MKRLNRLLIYLNLKNTSISKELDGDKAKVTNKDILKRDDYNASYYGDPHTYDWHNPELKGLHWRHRWTG